MPPQIKQDLNRSGWETTDFPSVCENCLPDNPFVQMIKQDYGEECKICTRPFTVFQWKPDRTARSKRTNICLTCARLKNCCQCCMLDLSFGLPIVVRDAALKMIAPGPQSEVNREYYAQNHEKEIEEGKGMEEYEKTDEKARELLRRLANSKPYFRKGTKMITDGGGESSASGGAGMSEKGMALATKGPGPIRTRDGNPSRGAGAGRGGRGGARGGRSFPSAAQLPPGPQDILPPADKSITSLFITGVEDDLPEFKIREFFSPYGKLRSLVCSHMSHCAFVNYATREGAEAAAAALQGKAVIAGCPLRVQWGKPRPIGTMDKEERAATGREGRSAFSNSSSGSGGQRRAIEGTTSSHTALPLPQQDDLASMAAVAAPPGSGDVQYASLAGN